MPKMRMVKQGSDITGENFDSAMKKGYKVYQQDSGPFQRFLPHMMQRDDKIMGMNDEQGQGNYMPYDDRNTVNQS